MHNELNLLQSMRKIVQRRFFDDPSLQRSDRNNTLLEEVFDKEGKPQKNRLLVKRTLNIKAQLRKTTFNIQRVLIITGLIGMALIAMHISTHLILLNNGSRVRKGLRLAALVEDWYNRFTTLQASFLEFVLWGKDRQVGSLSVKAFIEKMIEKGGKVVAEMELLGSQSDDLSREWMAILRKDTCEALKDKPADVFVTFTNCTSAANGSANLQLVNFFTQHLSIFDKFITVLNDYSTEARRATANSEEYSSMFVFSVYNSLGIYDTIYYTMLLPVTEMFKEVIKQMITTSKRITWADSAAFVVAVILLLKCLLMFMTRVRDYWSVIYIIPTRLIQKNRPLANSLKTGFKYT